MKAYIFKKLEKIYFGHNITCEKINGNKKNIETKVNEYIYKRMHMSGMVKVNKFMVEIYDVKNNLVKEFTYIPTYR